MKSLVNREIKFRGIPLFGKEFVYGSLIIDTDEKGEKVYVIRRIESGKVSNFEVKEETVGQYTGLKDKNGVMIYESDILVGLNRFGQQEIKINGIVKFMGSGFCVKSMYISNFNDRCEVIGNIYETPELLN